MPVGNGAVTLQNIPNEAFVTDPSSFFQMTTKNTMPAFSVPAPNPGSSVARQLPQTGVVSKLQIVFKGSITVSTAAATTSNGWPYNVLGQFKLSANGQNELFNCNGLDLHVLKYLKYPAYKDAVDVFPGTVGGGDSVGVGNYALNLTWEVPIAMDDTSLVGALYAQSSSTNLSVTLGLAGLSDMFSANGANVAISGTFYVQETFFEIPYDGQGQIVIPDLSRLHGFQAVDVPVNNTGDARLPLIRSAGQLSRLIVSGHASPNNRLSAAPNAATTKKLEALRLTYGGNQTPYNFDPIETLLSLNNQWYGSTPPYDRLVLDFVRENPVRDIVLLQGVTELNAIARVGAGVTLNGGLFHVVQETLF